MISPMFHEDPPDTFADEDHDLRLLQKLLDATPFPVAFCDMSIEPATDDDGDPAFMVHLVLDSPVALPRRISTPLQRFLEEVQNQAQDLGITRWPYFDVVNPPRAKTKGATAAETRLSQEKEVRGVIHAMIAPVVDKEALKKGRIVPLETSSAQ